MRLRLCLKAYDFQLIYVKGAQNTQADAVSRLPTSGKAFPTEDDDTPCIMAYEPHNLENSTEAWPEDWDEDAYFEKLFASRNDSENTSLVSFVSVPPKELI